MRLNRTDFQILHYLEHESPVEANVAANIAIEIGKSRGNVNSRFTHLLDLGLVEKIGPAERSGLYRITDRGRAALAHQDEYDHAIDFESLIDTE